MADPSESAEEALVKVLRDQRAEYDGSFFYKQTIAACGRWPTAHGVSDVSKNGKSNGVPETPEIDPHVLDLLNKGAAIRESKIEVHRRLKRLVDQLKRKFPKQHNMIMQQLEGQCAELLHERDKKKRLARANLSEGDTSERNGP